MFGFLKNLSKTVCQRMSEKPVIKDVDEVCMPRVISQLVDGKLVQSVVYEPVDLIGHSVDDFAIENLLAAGKELHQVAMSEVNSFDGIDNLVDKVDQFKKDLNYGKQEH